VTRKCVANANVGSVGILFGQWCKRTACCGENPKFFGVGGTLNIRAASSLHAGKIRKLTSVTAANLPMIRDIDLFPLMRALRIGIGLTDCIPGKS
jgi:hypothetical protein